MLATSIRGGHRYAMTSANSTITDQDLKQGLNAIATVSFQTTVNELSEQLEASVDTKPHHVTKYFGGPEGGRGASSSSSHIYLSDF